ncbi:MAG: site-specific integrase [Solirubrobacterales bacterium]|nr:site-specific integrase [Solirubrobacterales bacterium]
MEASSEPRGALVVYETKGGEPRYRAKWRDRTGRQCSPTIGPAWLTRKEERWVRRSGRPDSGFYDEQRAYLRMAELIAEHDAALPQPGDPESVPFEELAEAWLEFLSHGGRAKPSTLHDYRTMLAHPGPCARGGRERKARIMREFARRNATAITTGEVAAFLDRLVVEGLKARNVNRHRQALHAVFAFGMRPGTYGLAKNPVSDTEKQREDGPAAIDAFTTEELAAIERVAREGSHRARPNGWYGPAVHEEWQRMNDQDAAIVKLAAYTGLRQGELRALRWRHVFLGEQRLSVEEAISGDEFSTTKSRRVRSVPLTEAACDLMVGLRRRGRWLSDEDLLFCTNDGTPLNASALRRRFKQAQRKAGVRVRRFHDLRHTFGSIAVRRFDPVTVQRLMGHANLKTTERYLHSRPRADDATRLAEAFASDVEPSPKPTQPGPTSRNGRTSRFRLRVKLGP